MNIAPSHLYQNGDFVKAQHETLEIHRNFNKSQTKIVTLSGQKIYGACFSNSSIDEIYVISSYGYTIYFNIVNRTSGAKILTKTFTIWGEYLDEVLCGNGKIFIATYTNLYAFSHNSSFIKLWKYSYGT